jgi:hypothetical protein
LEQGEFAIRAELVDHQSEPSVIRKGKKESNQADRRFRLLDWCGFLECGLPESTVRDQAGFSASGRSVLLVQIDENGSHFVDQSGGH